MIHIITAVHNRYQITEKFVRNILRQTYNDIHLILVDDGSTDGTAKMVKDLIPDTTIIIGDGNLWWGGALHKAYLWGKDKLSSNVHDDVIFANDDTDFAEDYIEKAVKILKENPKTLLTGYGISRQSGKQVDGAVRFDFKKSSGQISQNGYSNCASTRSLFFTVADFLEIGGFHPHLLPHYASDYEWTIRAVQKYGYKVFCDNTLKYEADETTTGDNDYNKLTRKKLFSKRSGSNPFYKLIFIFLATPIKYIPAALWQQIRRYFGKLKVLIQILKR